jgi:glucose/mannose-6-phosphate isomerase
LALTKKIPAVIVPSGIMPRFAVGYLTGAFLGVLVKLKVILNPEKNLRGASKKIKGSAIEKDAKGVAKFFENKVPLIYTADEWRTLGHIWKISFNETAKLPSFHYILPELNHNELQGFTAKPLRQNKIFAALFLKEKSINPRLYKRFFLTEKFFASKGNIKSRGLILKGNNFWEKLISGTMLAYWTSYFLALKRGVVPEDESAIEEFKKLMR